MTWKIFQEKQKTIARVEKDLVAYRKLRNARMAHLLAGGPARLTEASRLRQIDEINRIDSICKRLASELAEMRRFGVGCTTSM